MICPALFFPSPPEVASQALSFVRVCYPFVIRSMSTNGLIKLPL
nr:MAG TPA: hypothetical protein [Caudoviricetes sp.]